MLLDGDDLAHDDAAELRADRLVGLDFEPCHGEALGELLPGNRWIAETAQPAFGNVHGFALAPFMGSRSRRSWVRARAQENCSKKRRSPSKNNRRSSMP